MLKNDCARLARAFFMQSARAAGPPQSRPAHEAGMVAMTQGAGWNICHRCAIIGSQGFAHGGAACGRGVFRIAGGKSCDNVASEICK